MKPTKTKPAKHVMTFVIRGDRQQLENLRKDLRLIGVKRDRSMSQMLHDAILDYIAAETAHAVKEAQ